MAEHRAHRDAHNAPLASQYLTGRETQRTRGNDPTLIELRHFEPWYGSSKIVPHSRHRTLPVRLPPLVRTSSINR